MIYTKGRIGSDEFLTADSTLQPMSLYRSVQQDFRELFHEGALACCPWDVFSRGPIQGCGLHKAVPGKPGVSVDPCTLILVTLAHPPPPPAPRGRDMN